MSRGIVSPAGPVSSLEGEVTPVGEASWAPAGGYRRYTPSTASPSASGVWGRRRRVATIVYQRRLYFQCDCLLKNGVIFNVLIVYQRAALFSIYCLFIKEWLYFQCVYERLYFQCDCFLKNGFIFNVFIKGFIFNVIVS